jgi:hypothetical protein
VRVLHDHQQRRLLRRTDGHPQQRGHHAFLQFAGRELECRVALSGGQAQQQSEDGRDVAARKARAFDHLFELVEPAARGLTADKFRGMPDLADHRMERVVDVVRRALVAQHQMRLLADPLAQRRQNA